ncbi:MAG: hypothetical protein HOP07_17775 [Bacteriovoracaceae bacterium]|nr:hypothetical protein [Bacteriovoracaceae bacterium]
MKATFFLKILISISIVSCATGEKFSSIREGMSKSQVKEVLGAHDQISRSEGGWSTYSYKNRLMSGWSWDKSDYYVVFDPNGKVYEYGHGEVDTRTSERMSAWGAQQLQRSKNSPTTIDCNSYTSGSITNTNCKASN